MAVSARAAKGATVPADVSVRTEGDRSRALAGTYPFETAAELVTGWHVHDMHQLEYAFEGTAQVETETARYLLPPQQAVWIPAGTSHCTTLSKVRTVSVFFGAQAGESVGGVRVIGVTPVIREMILHARRWPVRERVEDAAADAYFDVLADLVVAEAEHPVPLRLPVARDPLVAEVIRRTEAELATVTVGHVCREVGISERSLRRAFVADTGMPWRAYVVQSRLLRAMALLAERGSTVIEVSAAVGFESVSGFGRAFKRHTGKTPLAYRARVLAQPADAAERVWRAVM